MMAFFHVAKDVHSERSCGLLTVILFRNMAVYANHYYYCSLLLYRFINPWILNFVFKSSFAIAEWMLDVGL